MVCPVVFGLSSRTCAFPKRWPDDGSQCSASHLTLVARILRAPAARQPEQFAGETMRFPVFDVSVGVPSRVIVALGDA